jgi:gliding motility-associated-like protein
MLTINFSNSLDEFSNELLHPDALSIERRVEQGEDIFLDVDFRVIPIMTSVCRPMLNYDGSRINNGIITVLLTRGTFSGIVFKSRMNNTNDTIFDYDSTGVGRGYLSVLLWSSTINGQNPRLNKVFNKNEQEVKITSLFSSSNKVFNTKERDGCVPVLIENCISADTGYYTVEQFVYNEFGCVDTAYSVLHIYGNSFIYVPNAFSPDGNQHNQLFNMKSYGIESYELLIFNRWGEVIYTLREGDPGWDGTYKGKLQNPGVFTYVVDIKFLNDQDVQLKGSVTLLR